MRINFDLHNKITISTFVLPILILSLFTFTTDLNAAIAKKKNLSTQQAQFIAAEKAFKKGDLTTYNSLKAQLKHYPLVSYLDFEELSSELTVSNKANIDQFLSLQKHSPLATRLEARYLTALANQKHSQLFSDYYQDKFNSSKNTKLKCLYLNHQLATGKPKQKIYSQVAKLWAVAKSQPKECDPLFAQWKAAGKQTQAISFERFNKAARKGPLSMISYLKRYLPKSKQYLAGLWTKVRKNPGVIAKSGFFPKKDQYQEAAMAVFAIKKLAWGDREAAYRTWRKVNRNIYVPKNLAAEAERTLFLALTTENNPKAMTWAKRNISKYLNDELTNHWKLSTFIRAKEWKLVKEQFGLLPEKIQKTNQFRYWFAEASRQLGETAVADGIFKDLAKQRDYYGFKSAVKMKLPLQLNHHSSVISAETMKSVSTMSNVEKAKELIALDRIRDANREWRSLIKRLKTPEQFQAAAKIANQWGWFNQGIFTIAKAKIWDDTDLRFPTAFKEDYLVMGKKVGLPPEWLMAVTRQESAYGHKAVSGAGAYGLMQVLPSTAKIYSKKLGIKYKNRKDLFNPDTNIEMGSNYLKLRYDELDMNPIYASAAYNAGKHRIDKWKAFGRYPTEVWIESIPYTETRDYIKKVMTYRAIYAMKLNKKDTVFDYILNTYTGG